MARQQATLETRRNLWLLITVPEESHRALTMIRLFLISLLKILWMKQVTIIRHQSEETLLVTLTFKNRIQIQHLRRNHLRILVRPLILRKCKIWSPKCNTSHFTWKTGHQLCQGRKARGTHRVKAGSTIRRIKEVLRVKY